ncbi:unnamed protein product [Aureobasidium vineae]|uniref:Uncharacterized protein n=1 Tax=Aureobasidium vineae TaxID=2773715 RepID=A0A9N8K1T6_9PEZI|nr:unnamed protein product [Aureobasidium vineae]
MSEVQQTPNHMAPKIKSKRKTWLQHRRQVQIEREIAEQPDQSAEDDMSPSQNFEGAQRRASVQGTDTTTLMTPPIEFEEWSTKSCPPSAIRNAHNPPAARSTTPESIEAAPRVSTPRIMEIASQTAPKITITTDPTPVSHISRTTISTTAPSMSEHQIFAMLAGHNFFIPPSASLNTTSLILFKHDTPSLERFRLLHNQLFIELGRVVEEQLQPPPFPETSTEAYRQREELMLGLLTEVVPALNHLTERVGKEVKSGIQKHQAGLRLWAGERGQKEEGP